ASIAILAWRQNNRSYRKSASSLNPILPRLSESVVTPPATTRPELSAPWTHSKGSLRRPANAANCRLVCATPLTSTNESGKNATRGSTLIVPSSSCFFRPLRKTSHGDTKSAKIFLCVLRFSVGWFGFFPGAAYCDDINDSREKAILNAGLTRWL